MNIAIETTELTVPIESSSHQVFFEKYVDFKFSCRPTKIPHSKLSKMFASSQAYEYLLNVFDPNEIHVRESFYVMALNRNCRLIGVMKLSEGGITGTVVDMRLILCFLLSVLACGVILCHNHPSGNLCPSEHDKILTRKCIEATRFCEIDFQDHIIITSEDYLSMRDNGYL